MATLGLLSTAMDVSDADITPLDLWFPRGARAYIQR